MLGQRYYSAMHEDFIFIKDLIFITIEWCSQFMSKFSQFEDDSPVWNWLVQFEVAKVHIQTNKTNPFFTFYSVYTQVSQMRSGGCFAHI